MSDLFISYTREDQPAAQNLAMAFEARGWTVWWDRHLRGGQHFDEVIEREIKNAKCVIVVWSHRSIQSQYVKDEALYALTLDKLIPVAIDDALPPFRFQGLHTIALSGWSGSDSFPPIQKLLTDIDSAIRPPGRDAAVDTESTPGLAEHSDSSLIREPQETSNDEENSFVSKVREAAKMLRTTATYGEGFVPEEIPDQYSFKVYVGAFSGPKTADERAREEIALFMDNKSYAAFEILNRSYNFFPSYYKYTVQFVRR
jgi:TIR domain